MALTYEIIIWWSDVDDAFIVDVPELPGCTAYGPTYADAAREIAVAMGLWVDTVEEFGMDVPEPMGKRLEFSYLWHRKNVAFGAPRGEGRERAVDAALDLVGVRPQAERMPHELSGGQQQRVALARALAAKPSVVLLDEPFSNLDADLRQRVRGETRRILRDANATAVFVTHDQDEAFALADSVCIMLRGAVVQSGSPEDVCLSPVSLEAARFLGAANILDGERADGSVTCALGTLRVANAAAPDGAVKVSVRPETIRLRPEGGPTVEAEATFVEFRGAYKAVSLRLACGAEVTSIVGVGAGVPVEAGERLRIGVNGPVAVFPTEEPPD